MSSSNTIIFNEAAYAVIPAQSQIGFCFIYKKYPWIVLGLGEGTHYFVIGIELALKYISGQEANMPLNWVAQALNIADSHLPSMYLKCLTRSLESKNVNCNWLRQLHFYFFRTDICTNWRDFAKREIQKQIPNILDKPKDFLSLKEVQCLNSNNFKFIYENVFLKRLGSVNIYLEARVPIYFKRVLV